MIELVTGHGGYGGVALGASRWCHQCSYNIRTFTSVTGLAALLDDTDNDEDQDEDDNDTK